jgi:muconolactone delta-isomerase
MADLLVPVVISLVLLALVLLARRLPSDPHARWRELAQAHGYTFEAPNAEAHGMSVRGELHGARFELRCRAVHNRQFLSTLTVELPHPLPAGVVLRCALPAFEALQRGRSADRHDPKLPRVWRAEGLSEAATQALADDPACHQRLTNLLVSYPHATVRADQVQVEAPADFGSQVDPTVQLATALAADLARLAPRLSPAPAP